MSALESDTDLRIEVGNTYRDRNGQNHYIEDWCPGLTFPARSSKHCWTSSGKWLEQKGHSLDLIEEVKPSIDDASPEEWNELSSSEAIRQLLDEASQKPPPPPPKAPPPAAPPPPPRSALK